MYVNWFDIVYGGIKWDNYKIILINSYLIRFIFNIIVMININV